MDGSLERLAVAFELSLEGLSPFNLTSISKNCWPLQSTGMGVKLRKGQIYTNFVEVAVETDDL